MNYYSAKTASKMLGVTAQTLRNWDKEGKLKPSYVKSNGYRYYSEESLLEFTNQKPKKVLNVVGYARVSSQKQQDDLERQVSNLSDYLKKKHSNFKIITDIGSGINYNKPGLKELIRMICKHEVDLIVVLYKDRLVRFGYEIIEYVAQLNNVRIEVLDRKLNKTQDQELVEDLIQIITVFSCKLQGKRKTQTKEILNDFEKKMINELENITL